MESIKLQSHWILEKLISHRLCYSWVVGVGEGGGGEEWGGGRENERERKNIRRIHCRQHFDNENDGSIQRFSFRKGFCHLAVWQLGKEGKIST